MPVLSPKERVRRALSYQPVDRLPVQLNYTGGMARQMAAHFGVPIDGLPQYFGNHLLRLDVDHAGALSADGLARFDWWGAGHDITEEGYFIRVSPLAGAGDLDAFAWPDPHAPGLLDGAQRLLAAHGGGQFVVPNLGFALFERAWSLRGFEQFFLDLAHDPAYVSELLDRIVAIQLVLIERFLDLGVDGGYFGDDYGAQRGLLFSPRMWRKLIKPRLAQLFAPFRAHGLPVIMHSDGQIQAILPDLLEIGLTVLNPVQPEVLAHAWLRREYGGRLAFYGGVSTQAVLPHGTPNEVREAVAACIRELAPDGTGLMIAPSHRMMQDIPLGNVVALLEALGISGKGTDS